MTTPDQFAVDGIGLIVVIVGCFALLIALAVLPEYRRRRRLRRPLTDLPPPDDPRLRNVAWIREWKRRRARRERFIPSRAMTTCVVCGCTDGNACVDLDTLVACHWCALSADRESGVCSACDESYEIPQEDAVLAPSRELILPGDPEFHL